MLVPLDKKSLAASKRKWDKASKEVTSAFGRYEITRRSDGKGYAADGTYALTPTQNDVVDEWLSDGRAKGKDIGGTFVVVLAK